jgi:hypothetical protein
MPGRTAELTPGRNLALEEELSTVVTPLPLGRIPAQELDWMLVLAVSSDGLYSASATMFSIPGVW